MRLHLDKNEVLVFIGDMFHEAATPENPGLTYVGLGKELGLSEGSVKQLMTRGQFTMDRLESISQVFGLTLLEFMEIAYKMKQGTHKITLKQEEILLEFPVSIALMFLLGSGFPLDQAKVHLGVDRNKFQKALYVLDRAGIIILLSDNRITLKARGPYRFNKDGVVQKKLRPGYLKLIAEQIAVMPAACLC